MPDPDADERLHTPHHSSLHQRRAVPAPAGRARRPQMPARGCLRARAPRPPPSHSGRLHLVSAAARRESQEGVQGRLQGRLLRVEGHNANDGAAGHVAEYHRHD